MTVKFDEIAILHFRFSQLILLHVHTHVLVIIFVCTHSRLTYPLFIAIYMMLSPKKVSFTSPQYPLSFFFTRQIRASLPLQYPLSFFFTRQIRASFQRDHPGTVLRGADLVARKLQRYPGPRAAGARCEGLAAHPPGQAAGRQHRHHAGGRGGRHRQLGSHRGSSQATMLPMMIVSTSDITDGKCWDPSGTSPISAIL